MKTRESKMKALRKPEKSSYLTRHFSPHESNSPVLKLNKISYRYDKHMALEDINLELMAGERVAVVGPNGAGKSTFFKLIAGVISPTEGQIDVYGHKPGEHICIAYVPQRSQVDWNFPVSVAEVVMMGRVSKVGLFRFPSSKDWKAVKGALKSVKMEHLAKRQINELSGGQQQRVFLARALAQEAELILLDEPFTGLDLTTLEDLFTMLDGLREHKVTIMVALHDLKLAAERFDRVMLLNRRLLGIGKPDSVFQPQKLEIAYGEHLRLIQTGEGIMVLEDTCCEEGDHQHA
jgi:manganese/iron transport system ATP-binding protein